MYISGEVRVVLFSDHMLFNMDTEQINNKKASRKRTSSGNSDQQSDKKQKTEHRSSHSDHSKRRHKSSHRSSGSDHKRKHHGDHSKHRRTEDSSSRHKQVQIPGLCMPSIQQPTIVQPQQTESEKKPKKTTAELKLQAEVMLNTAFGYHFRSHPGQTCIFYKTDLSTCGPEFFSKVCGLVCNHMKAINPHIVCGVFNPNESQEVFFFFSDPTISLNETTISVSKILKKANVVMQWKLMETFVLNAVTAYRPLFSSVVPDILRARHLVVRGPNYSPSTVSVSRMMADAFKIKYDCQKASTMMNPVHTGLFTDRKFGYVSKDERAQMFLFSDEVAMTASYERIITRFMDRLGCPTSPPKPIVPVIQKRAVKRYDSASSSVSVASGDHETDPADTDPSSSDDIEQVHLNRNKKSHAEPPRRFAAPKMTMKDTEDSTTKTQTAFFQMQVEEAIRTYAEDDDILTTSETTYVMRPIVNDDTRDLHTPPPIDLGDLPVTIVSDPVYLNNGVVQLTDIPVIQAADLNAAGIDTNNDGLKNIIDIINDGLEPPAAEDCQTSSESEEIALSNSMFTSQDPVTPNGDPPSSTFFETLEDFTQIEPTPSAEPVEQAENWLDFLVQ